MNSVFSLSDRQCFSPTALFASAVLLLLANSVRAQNATNNFTGSATASLLINTNWSLGHVPTVSEDAVFPVGAATGIRPLTAGSLTVGSFDVLATTGTFSIRNNTSTQRTAPLPWAGLVILGTEFPGLRQTFFIMPAGAHLILLA
jgi:hypothetical protein